MECDADTNTGDTVLEDELVMDVVCEGRETVTTIVEPIVTTVLPAESVMHVVSLVPEVSCWLARPRKSWLAATQATRKFLANIITCACGVYCALNYGVGWGVIRLVSKLGRLW
jgi:hypothetical protein